MKGNALIHPRLMAMSVIGVTRHMKISGLPSFPYKFVAQ